MTENQDIRPSADNPQDAIKSSTGKKAWFNINWLIWPILVGTAMLAGFTGWEQLRSKQIVSDLTQQNHDLGIKLLELQRAQKNTTASITSFKLKFEQQLSGVDEAISELHSFQSGQLGGDSRWKLAEVSYLIRIAEHALAMQQQPAQALTALREADQLLASLDLPGVYALRAALAGDIGSLSNFKGIDQVGIFLNIASLVNQVELLEIATRGFSSQEPVSEYEKALNPGFLGRMLEFLKKFGEKVFSLVDFRRGDIEIKPLPTPEQTLLLKQNILMQLQTAQLALLRGEQGVFLSSIKQAQTWVESYFDTNLAETRQLIEQLSLLHDMPISVSLPKLTDTLLALDELQSLQPESLQ
jgi:uroporphyrin-III C-methyltransferase